MPDNQTLVIACGALAREVAELIKAHRWSHMTVKCLPASLHNTPHMIPSALRDKISAQARDFGRILVLYGDCGTAGGIDEVIAEETAKGIEVECIGGAHCFEFLTGAADYQALCEEEPGSFFVTDFLALNFDTLVVRGLGLDGHPHLLDRYFGNYRRLVLLSQSADPAISDKGAACAKRLGLEFEERFTGLGAVAGFLASGGNEMPLT